MKVAIIHYWLVGMRGGEKVIEALCEMYPEADIFTHVVDPEAISEKLRRHKIRTSFISRLPRPKQNYKSYLPLMPLALEQLDLRGYDLIISSESGPAKGIIPPAEATHVCYCHTPMRYIWNMYAEYRASAGFLVRAAMPLLSHYLRGWDQASAARVDRFAANSSIVAARIRKYYRRNATIVHPPVDVDLFARRPGAEIGDYYLMVGELVAYKRPDLAVRAFNKAGKKLVVVGSGEMLPAIRRLAGPTVEVLGSQPFERLRDLYAGCRALVFPGEEDFGIVPVEAMASGRPVIAYRRGGVLDTVVDGVTGVLFEEPTEEALLEAVARCERLDVDPAIIRAHAQWFGKKRFVREMGALIADELAKQAKQLERMPPAPVQERLPLTGTFTPRPLAPVRATYAGSERHGAA